MIAHKVIRTSAILALLVAGAAAAGADLDSTGSADPAADQRFCARLVRRTLEQQVRDQTDYEVPYVPPSLRDLECQVIVTLRQHGHVRGTGSSPRLPVVIACRDAALAALASAAQTGPTSLEWLKRVTIEIEAVGGEVVVPFEGQWSDDNAFNRLIESRRGRSGPALRAAPVPLLSVRNRHQEHRRARLDA